MSFIDKPEFIEIPYKGAAIECAVYLPERSAVSKIAGLVIHLYGHNGSSRDCNIMRQSYVEVRRILWERGYLLAIPNLGGSHWMSDSAVGIMDTTIVTLLEKYEIDAARVHLIGTSMGGGSSLIYAMCRPHRIRSICAIFPMTDFAQWAQESPCYLEKILQAHGIAAPQAVAFLHTLSPLHHAASLCHIPMLLIHGDADSVVPIHHSRDFVAELTMQNAPVIYREVPGVGHDDAIAEHWQHEIAAFLTETSSPLECKSVCQ